MQIRTGVAAAEPGSPHQAVVAISEFTQSSVGQLHNIWWQGLAGTRNCTLLPEVPVKLWG